jgi:hypothetical protein
MLKRTMAVAIAMLFVMAAGSAAAQCTIGVYSDAAGTSNVATGMRNGDPFHVYVVVFDEAALNAVSYGLVVPGLNQDIYLMNSAWGPTGDGINIMTSNGSNVGLGECAPGFYGSPILVADYTLLYPDYALPRTVSVVANPDSDPNLPVVSDCTGVLHTCDFGPTCMVDGPIPAESHSFGEVKALYNNQ